MNYRYTVLAHCGSRVTYRHEFDAYVDANACAMRYTERNEITGVSIHRNF